MSAQTSTDWPALLTDGSWILNMTLLVAVTLWVFCDGWARGTIETLHHSLSIADWASGAAVGESVLFRARTIILVTDLLLAAATFGAMFTSLIVGTQQSRSIRSWLLFICILSGWLSLNTLWPEVHWRGQQVRVLSKLPAYQKLVRTLAEQWPDTDGNIRDLGVVLVYPEDKPTTLLMANGGISDARICIASATRSASGTLRFQLSGGERGSWLEWSPRRRPPESFVDGLGTRYDVERAGHLTDDWFLVRYSPEQ